MCLILLAVTINGSLKIFDEVCFNVANIPTFELAFYRFGVATSEFSKKVFESSHRYIYSSRSYLVFWTALVKSAKNQGPSKNFLPKKEGNHDFFEQKFFFGVFKIRS